MHERYREFGGELGYAAEEATPIHESFPRIALPFDSGFNDRSSCLACFCKNPRPSRAETNSRTTIPLISEMSPVMKRTAGRDLRQLANAIRPSPRLRQVTQQTPRRSYASDERPTFKGQLYESTQARLERERAEQARFARLRAEQKPAGGAPIWMTPISTKTKRLH